MAKARPRSSCGGDSANTSQKPEAVLAALGDDLDKLLDLTRPWATAVVEAKGYPVDPSSLATIARR